MRLCITILLLAPFGSSIFAQNTSEHGDSYQILPGNSVIQVNTQKLDSIQHEFSQKWDSLRKAYQPQLSRLESIQSDLKRKLDSLSSLQFSDRRINHALDSVTQLHAKTVATLNAKLDKLKDKTTGKVQALNMPPELSAKVSSITRNVESFTFKSASLDLPSLDLPDNPLGDVGGDNLSQSLSNLGQVDGLRDVNEGVSEVSGITGEISGYGQDVEQLTQANLNQVKELPNAAEAKAADLSGLNDIEKQTQSLDEYKEIITQFQDPQGMKGQGIENLQQAAMDHFAGKEKVLREAMDKMAKYKKKYASVTSIKDLPKRPPNEMRGKPIIERLLPGIGLQFQKKGNDFLVDFNPYLGYRFTGILTAGMGWTQRVAYNTHDNYFNAPARVYGPRSYAECKVWKGFAPRVELEVVNAYVKPFSSLPTLDQGGREWVWGAFIGIKKEYHIMNHINGTALIMTRIFDPHHKSPYSNVINARIGFEFPMKKRTRRAKSASIP